MINTRQNDFLAWARINCRLMQRIPCAKTGRRFTITRIWRKPGSHNTILGTSGLGIVREKRYIVWKGHRYDDPDIRDIHRRRRINSI